MQPSSDHNPGSRRGLMTVVRVGLVILLAIYWSSMFFGTHVTRMPQSLAGQSDKLLHLCAYAGLAVLLLSWRISRGPITLRKVILLWLMIGAYGVFDEVTQPLVGRNSDVKDWLADLIGAAIGLTITWPVAMRMFRSVPADSNPM